MKAKTKKLKRNRIRITSNQAWMISNRLHDKIQFYGPAGQPDNDRVLEEVQKAITGMYL